MTIHDFAAFCHGFFDGTFRIVKHDKKCHGITVFCNNSGNNQKKSPEYCKNEDPQICPDKTQILIEGPLGISWRAVTMPSTPICLSIERVILSFLPNHLHVFSIIVCCLSDLRLCKGKSKKSIRETILCFFVKFQRLSTLSAICMKCNSRLSTESQAMKCNDSFFSHKLCKIIVVLRRKQYLCSR